MTYTILEAQDLADDPPYSAIEVYGTPLTEKLRTAFNGFGFMVFSEHTDGFRASIRVAAGV